MKKYGSIITIGLLAFLLTFLIALQFKTVKQSESDILRYKTENQLRDEINKWQDMYAIATEKIRDLDLKVEEYKQASASNNDATMLINQELKAANIAAGITAVKGKGIKITLDDTDAINKIYLDSGYYDPNAFVIHDTDLLQIVNELRAAGAEAISLNEQRITANTEIRCVGPVVSVNNARLAAPYVICAIGNPDILASALQLRHGIVDSLRAADIDVTIEKQNELVIPKYDKVITNKYATPIETEES